MSTVRPGRDAPGPGHDPTLVGAYLLGTLEPAEHAAVERHLAGCEECRRELADLQELPALLDRINVADLADAPVAGDELFARVAAAVEAEERERHLRRRARMVLAGAAAAVVLAGGAVAGVTLSGGGPATAQRSFSASAGPVHMTVTVTPRSGGSALAVNVSGLPQEEHCRLIAVATSGARETAGSWTASYAGRAHVSGLTTSYQPAQLSEVVLRLDHSHRQVAVHT